MLNIAPAPAPAPKAINMAALRAALPMFFVTGVDDLVKSLTDKGTRIEALSQALAGCALERAQSGNLPKSWGLIETASNALKGQTKARALAALALVAGVKPQSGKGYDLPTYEAFGYETMVAIVATLTPAPAAPKAKTDKVDYKALSEALALEVATLENEALALRHEVATLKGLPLPTPKVSKAPAMLTPALV